MEKITPNLYVEAYGVLFHKRSGEDCRASMQGLLAKHGEKRLIAELFQPSIEMMDACADLCLNPENPLYTDAASLSDSNVKVGLDFDLFQHYYDIRQEIPPSRCIYAAFCEDQGKTLVTTAVCPLSDETCEDAVPFVLNCKAEDSLKVALLKILVEGELWISEFCHLLEQIANRIAPIMEKYEPLYSYADRLFSQKDCADSLFRYTGMHLPEDTSLLPCLSICNAAHVFSKNEQGQMRFTLYIGLLLCAIDFFLPEKFDPGQLCDHLKMLADPTKLAILRILKDGSTYQSDLARQLSLTTATISHHMGQLFQNGFVESELKNKKLYYRYQPQMVDYTLEQAGNYLKPQEEKQGKKSF